MALTGAKTLYIDGQAYNATTRPSGETCAIFDEDNAYSVSESTGVHNDPLVTNPYASASRLHFHSDLKYLQVAQTVVDRTYTIPNTAMGTGGTLGSYFRLIPFVLDIVVTPFGTFSGTTGVLQYDTGISVSGSPTNGIVFTWQLPSTPLPTYSIYGANIVPGTTATITGATYSDSSGALARQYIRLNITLSQAPTAALSGNYRLSDNISVANTHAVCAFKNTTTGGNRPNSTSPPLYLDRTTWTPLHVDSTHTISYISRYSGQGAGRFLTSNTSSAAYMTGSLTSVNTVTIDGVTTSCLNLLYLFTDASAGNTGSHGPGTTTFYTRTNILRFI